MDSYSLFSMRYEQRMDGSKGMCRAILPITSGITLQQASEIASWIYSFEGFLPDDEGYQWKELIISCVVRDGCSLPKPEFINPTTFKYWEDHHHYLVQHAKVL